VAVVTIGTTFPASHSDGREPASAGYSYVTPNYFETLSIPIVRGRTFTPLEAEGKAPIVIISEATGRRFWPNGDPIGKRLKIGSERGTVTLPGESDPFIASSEVVGIARDVRSMDPSRLDESYLYLPFSQNRQWSRILLVRTVGNPAPLLPVLGSELRRVDANLPVSAATLNTMVSMDPYFVVSRIGGFLASIVSALGLLLACMGVYGMVAYSVAQRTREIGIRVAFGAERGQILRLILRDGMRSVLVGLVIGLATAVATSRVLAAMLFGLSALDAFSFAGVSLLLCAVATLACWLPARKAIRVDPVVALRHE